MVSSLISAVMQVRGHRVSGLLLKEDFSDLWVVEIRRSWAHDLWEVDYWTKGQTPHWAKCTGDLAPKTSTWKRKRWKSRFRKKKWKIEKDAEESKVRIEERTDNHSSAWHMDGMTRTNTWVNVVSHSTRARCEREKGDVWGVLFTWFLSGPTPESFQVPPILYPLLLLLRVSSWLEAKE